MQMAVWEGTACAGEGAREVLQAVARVGPHSGQCRQVAVKRVRREVRGGVRGRDVRRVCKRAPQAAARVGISLGTQARGASPNAGCGVPHTSCTLTVIIPITGNGVW